MLCGSEPISVVAFPSLINDYYYSGKHSSIFELAEAEFNLEDLFSVELSGRGIAILEAEDAVAYLDELLVILREHDDELPYVYSFEKSSTGERFAEARLDARLRVQSGFDHCVMFTEDGLEITDLREKESISADGEVWRVLRCSAFGFIHDDLHNMLEVAKTATTYRRHFVLRAS